MKSRRLGGNYLGKGLLVPAMQPKKYSRGATQRHQRADPDRRLSAHALCLTLTGNSRLPAALLSYNIFLCAEIIRLPSPVCREL